MLRFLEGVLVGALLYHIGWDVVSSVIETGVTFAKGLF